ncbi:MAG: glycolate oxidase subunit GlcE [Steroidobacterales bacterium]
MHTDDPELKRLVDRVQGARAARTALDIRGGGTKLFYGEAARGEPLDMRGLAGISSYEPSELVVTARAGTPLAELEQVLAQQGQCLAFEPPRFAPHGTVGGMIAAGLSGPARASAGAVRDFTLGLSVLNGDGETLSFGGQVMKNVAGYDVSRLMAGSWGVLGAILEVSIKVLPVRPATATRCLDVGEPEALDYLLRLAARPLPLHASAWLDGRLSVRLAGARAAVEEAGAVLGGELLEAGAADGWWTSIRDQRHEFFAFSPQQLSRGECLWRLSVPARTPPLALPGRQLIEWGGALRWWRGDAPAEVMREAAAGAGGHATLVRAADKRAGAFAPLPSTLMRIHRDLKAAFDPAGVFNPGRLYAGL